MADISDQRLPLYQGSADETGKGGECSVDEMKSLLQKVEQRLTGHTSAQAHISMLDAASDWILPHMLPKLDRALSTEPYVTVASGIAQVDPAKAINDNERRLAHQAKRIVAIGETRKSKASSDWFHLPRTNLTPELKRDLQLLKMRSTWDPKRHYKNDSRKPPVPEYSQVGTIIEGPTEHYSSRIAKRDRKGSFVDEIMAAEKSTGHFKNKSLNIQTFKTSGRRAFYNHLKQKRSKGFIRS
ncbi:MAG: hypothetical protein Q9166_007916 [cf. Caloplaca sp. 2 TL-2023]